MKNVVLTIFSLGAVGLVSALPVPAGGYYPAPNYPYPNYPNPDPFGGIAGGLPGYPPNPFGGLPKAATQMCNCNNPATKETSVEPFCEQAGGKEQYRVFQSLEPVKQHMCILSSAWSDVYSNYNCQKQFGPGFNGFCSNYL